MRVSLLERKGLFARPPAPRGTGEVEDEIAEELEFHLEMRARELVEAGVGAAQARAAAEARFGDLGRIRAECRRIQIGERMMLQRLNAVATVLLVGVACWLGWQLARSRAEAAETAAMVGELREEIAGLSATLRAGGSGPAPGFEAAPPEVRAAAERRPDRASEAAQAPADPRAWLARFSEEMSWRDALAVGYEIAALDPERALEVMRAIYRDLPSVTARQQILKAFVFHGGHPYAVEVLELAATDPEAEVRGWAYGYLESYAFQDLSEDHQRCLDWLARFGGRPLDEVLERNAAELAERLRTATTAELEHALSTLDRLDLSAGEKAGVDLAVVLKESGVLTALSDALRVGDEDAREAALEWMKKLAPDEAFLRAEVLPLLDARDDVSLVSAACGALGQRGNGWAVEPLLGSLQRVPSGEPGALYSHAMALAEIGDARAIPALIALIEADPSEDTVYGLGYYALKDLTGVDYDGSHDGAFWRAWWEGNKHLLPAGVREQEIPALAFQR